MGYIPRTVAEMAHEAERELLRIAKQTPGPPWGLLSLVEQQRYAQRLAESFAGAGK